MPRIIAQSPILTGTTTATTAAMTIQEQLFLPMTNQGQLLPMTMKEQLLPMTMKEQLLPMTMQEQLLLLCFRPAVSVARHRSVHMLVGYCCKTHRKQTTYSPSVQAFRDRGPEFRRHMAACSATVRVLVKRIVKHKIVFNMCAMLRRSACMLVCRQHWAT